MFRAEEKTVQCRPLFFFVDETLFVDNVMLSSFVCYVFFYGIFIVAVAIVSVGVPRL
jgi:hypothetical protein